jgi:lactate dehydrogenase-like 2-hydroxyacid dehydrogenase
MSSRIKIFRAAEDLPEKTVRELDDAFAVVRLPRDAEGRAAAVAEHGSEVRGIAARQARIDAELIGSLPALEIISCYAAGLDGIDVAAAASRGVEVRNTSHVLAEDVADVAVSLLIGVTRGMVRAHNFVVAGDWSHGDFPLGQTIQGLKAGIVGFGHIGAAIARRLEAMRMEVGYHGPRRKPVPQPYFATVESIAEWADVIILACPASPETYHLVDGRVLAALGPHGYLINVARGSVVDESALVDALAQNGIAGAGLDVFEDEPRVPAALCNDPRVILAPHMGSATRQTRQGMGDSMVAALVRRLLRPAPTAEPTTPRKADLGPAGEPAASASKHS